MMLLWAWESNSLSCCQHSWPDHEARHNSQQQLLYHTYCTLSRPSSKRIAHHQVSFSLDHPSASCGTAASELTSLEQGYMDFHLRNPFERLTSTLK